METKATEETHILTDKYLIKVLLVEDDVCDRRLHERLLARRPRPVEFAVESVGTMSAAVECLDRKEYDFVLLGLKLPGSAGIQTLQKIQEVGPTYLLWC